MTAAKNAIDYWEEIGALADDEVMQTLTRLVALYGDRLEQNDEDREALTFFRTLDIALDQVRQCNLNRR
ncbi:MAG: hypothetical protein ACOY4H_06420 [Thermodesulfobacteriota bacterium]